MNHYVVIFDFVLDSMEGSTDILGVTHTFEEAKEIFDKNVQSEKEYAQEHEWTVWENNESCFDASPNGRWCESHTRLWIQGVI